MKWLSIYKYGTPNRDEYVLTYSECYSGRPELAYRIMYGQFVRMCKDITHYVNLKSPSCEILENKRNRK